MRRLPALAVALLLALAACGDDDGGAPADPAALTSCEQVADASIALMQDAIDIIDSLSTEELAEFGTSEETPEVFRDVEAQGTALENRAEAIGCTEEQMNSLLAARVDDLSSDTTFGQFIIESVRSGEGGFFG